VETSYFALKLYRFLGAKLIGGFDLCLFGERQVLLQITPVHVLASGSTYFGFYHIPIESENVTCNEAASSLLLNTAIGCNRLL